MSKNRTRCHSWRCWLSVSAVKVVGLTCFLVVSDSEKYGESITSLCHLPFCESLKTDMLIVMVEVVLWCWFIDEMLMSVLWYYRLEHTGTAPLPRYIDREVFASRHRDVIPVKCIEDRCYVLTLNEFNMWRHCHSILSVSCIFLFDMCNNVSWDLLIIMC